MATTRKRIPCLSELARPAGFTQASLAAVTNIDRATISRHWSAHNWLQNMGLDTYMILCAYIPELADATPALAMSRRKNFEANFGKHDLTVSREHIHRAINEFGIRWQFLQTGLDAAGFIMDENIPGAVRCLRTLWGQRQTAALDIVFGTHSSCRALTNSRGLIDAAVKMAESILASNQYLPFPKAVAVAHLAHHTAKTGRYLSVVDFPGTAARATKTNQNIGFVARAATMGILRNTDDLDLVNKYKELVDEDGLVFQIEGWAFPSWSGDAEVGDSFELPRKTPLNKTATEVIREIREYNEAYVLYLVQTYIPLALEETDPTFGGQLGQLLPALDVRAETLTHKAVRDQCCQLAKEIRADITVA